MKKDATRSGLRYLMALLPCFSAPRPGLTALK